MDQRERRLFLLNALLGEEPRTRFLPIPEDAEGQRRLLRSLLNVRPPRPVKPAFLAVQDAYLQERRQERGITRLEDLAPLEGDLFLWRGDITTLQCDGIVNAANSGLLGCFQPLHSCIDNCIHTYAGVQLRLACAALMEAQGHEEPTGGAKLTPAYNLPSRFVLHTVGPIVQGPLTPQHRAQLASCYRACLDTAAEAGCQSLAFCCISTGVFRFPQKEAATVAVETVRAWKQTTGSGMKVIFNVFSADALALYRRILG